MNLKWELRRDYYVKNAYEFLSKKNDNYHNYGVALKATPVVAEKLTGKEKRGIMINKIIKAHGSDSMIMQRCLNLDSSPEDCFNLVEYNEREDNYRIRIWDLVGIDDDEYMDLQILRT